jgi:hypothetical protein
VKDDAHRVGVERTEGGRSVHDSVREDAGVVHQHVEPALGRFDGGQRVAHRRVVGHVELHESGAQLRSDLLAALDVAGADVHDVAQLEKLFGGLETDALACSPENTRISEMLAAGRAVTESALVERLFRAAADGDLPDGMDARALARFVMTLSEGHAVHAAAGASREDLQTSVDIAMRAVALHF